MFPVACAVPTTIQGERGSGAQNRVMCQLDRLAAVFDGLGLTGLVLRGRQREQRVGAFVGVSRRLHQGPPQQGDCHLRGPAYHRQRPGVTQRGGRLRIAARFGLEHVDCNEFRPSASLPELAARGGVQRRPVGNRRLPISAACTIGCSNCSGRSSVSTPARSAQPRPP